MGRIRIGSSSSGPLKLIGLGVKDQKVEANTF